MNTIYKVILSDYIEYEDWKIFSSLDIAKVEAEKRVGHNLYYVAHINKLELEDEEYKPITGWSYDGNEWEEDGVF